MTAMEILKGGRHDPYGVCPEHESERFLLRLVALDDAEDLLACYSDPASQRLFNADNCTSDFRYATLDEMRSCIAFWLSAYANREFIRFSIVDKRINRAVGTVEIFGGGRGVLRIDIRSDYEREDALAELLETADLFFRDVDAEELITKAVPEATQRINALAKSGYAPYATKYEHYFMKSRPE